MMKSRLKPKISLKNFWLLHLRNDSVTTVLFYLHFGIFTEYSGTSEVKKHPFLADINWDTLLTTEPAFVPKLEDPESTAYFKRKNEMY